MREQIRCAAGAVALWLHDHREPIKSAAGFAALSLLAGAACWLYCAVCWVVNA